jgi:hypothetical protein
LEDVGIFYDHLVYFNDTLVYFVTIWSILWSFGIFHNYLEYFFTFWYVVPRKIWQPWPIARKRAFEISNFGRGCLASWKIVEWNHKVGVSAPPKEKNDFFGQKQIRQFFFVSRIAVVLMPPEALPHCDFGQRSKTLTDTN